MSDVRSAATAVQAGLGRSAPERRWASLVSVGILALGLVLRLVSARGDLWYDEIWTLDLLTRIKTPDEIFWNISHDNNHFLNSLWMDLIGLNGTPLLYRLPSVLMGMASVGVAARIGARRGDVAGLLTAFVIAVGFPFVNYGSEARGYGGLVLALLVAIDALDRVLSAPADAASDRPRWTLGLAIGLGALSHLTMFLGAGILGLAAAAQVVSTRPRPTLRAAVRTLAHVFFPSVLLSIPAVAAVTAGIISRGHLTLGGTSYAPGRFVTGLGGMAGAVLGLPAACPAWLSVAAVTAGLILAAQFRLVSGLRAWIALVGLVLVPVAVAVANPPNTEYPRYFLICGVILALTMAEAAARASTMKIGVWLVPALLVAFTAGQFALDGRLMLVGRGAVSRLVSAMAAQPGSTYAAPFYTAPELSIDYYSYRANVVIKRIPLPLSCDTKPDWYIYDVPRGVSAAPDAVTVGPDACPMVFAKTQDYPTSTFSGSHWTLFKRQ